MTRRLHKPPLPICPSSSIYHRYHNAYSTNAPWLNHPSRGIATSLKRSEEYDPAPESVPKWRATPSRMVAPVRVRPEPYHPDEFKINTSSQILDEVYINLLGNGGEEVLTEEVKWLAVTHKSFDHGRRGYNDRLAFLGREVYAPVQSRMLREMLRREAHRRATNLTRNTHSGAIS